MCVSSDRVQKLGPIRGDVDRRQAASRVDKHAPRQRRRQDQENAPLDGEGDLLLFLEHLRNCREKSTAPPRKAIVV